MFVKRLYNVFVVNEILVFSIFGSIESNSCVVVENFDSEFKMLVRVLMVCYRSGMFSVC